MLFKYSRETRRKSTLSMGEVYPTRFPSSKPVNVHVLLVLKSLPWPCSGFDRETINSTPRYCVQPAFPALEQGEGVAWTQGGGHDVTKGKQYYGKGNRRRRSISHVEPVVLGISVTHDYPAFWDPLPKSTLPRCAVVTHESPKILTRFEPPPPPRLGSRRWVRLLRRDARSAFFWAQPSPKKRDRNCDIFE